MIQDPQALQMLKYFSKMTQKMNAFTQNILESEDIVLLIAAKQDQIVLGRN